MDTTFDFSLLVLKLIEALYQQGLISEQVYREATAMAK